MDGYFEMNNANGLSSQLLVYTTTTKEITIILSDGLVSHGYHVTNCFTAFRDEQDTTIIKQRDQDSGNILFIEMDVVNCELILVIIPGSDGFLKYNKNGSCQSEGKNSFYKKKYQEWNVFFCLEKPNFTCLIGKNSQS